MTNFSSYLGLSGAALQQLSEAYEGYAAAIYRSILDPASSIPLFGAAAGVYRRQSNSFWKLLAICGLKRDWLFGQEAGRAERHPQEFFYELLRQYFLFNSGDENALGRMLEYASSTNALHAQPVGNPPIPLQDYLAFIRGDIEKAYYSNGQAPGDHPGWDANLRVLLQRSADRFQLLRRNRFQWNNAIGFLPFEPDILATLLCFSIRNRNREYLRQFLETESRRENSTESRQENSSESRRENSITFLVALALEMIEASQ
jgi:hypothetical protein